MKKILIVIAFIAILGVGATQISAQKPAFLNNLLTYSLCDEPVKYRIDTVDPKFNLSTEDFTQRAREGAEIWNKAWGKDLLVYDPQGSLSVNLIYDERQTLTNQINELEDDLQSDKTSLNPKIAEFEKKSQEFKKKVDDLNKRVEEWNSKGGAPSDEYKKIIEEQEALRRESESLNDLAKSLNLSTREYNSQVNQLNQTIKNFNTALEERPEEGIYKGPENRIEIYFNVTKNGIVHTLAHEFGHALGLEHVTNPKAIMYSKTNQTIIPTEDDLLILKDLCKERSITELIQTYISQLLLRFKQVN